jgi:hypothetical protein
VKSGSVYSIPAAMKSFFADRPLLCRSGVFVQRGCWLLDKLERSNRELAKRAYELFTSSQPAQKNKLLKMTLATLELKDGKLIPKLKNFFQGVLICNERQLWLPRLEDIRTAMIVG